MVEKQSTIEEAEELCRENLESLRSKFMAYSTVTYTLISAVVLLLLVLMETNLVRSKLSVSSLTPLFFLNVIHLTATTVQVTYLLLQGQ